MTKDELRRFNEAAPLLGNVLARASKPVVRNSHKLQKDDADTCGRWVAARIMNADMPLHKFVDNMMAGKGTPDQAVTDYTYQFLRK
jgi:hypothetical protein